MAGHQIDVVRRAWAGSAADQSARRRCTDIMGDAINCSPWQIGAAAGGAAGRRIAAVGNIYVLLLIAVFTAGIVINRLCNLFQAKMTSIRR